MPGWIAANRRVLLMLVPVLIAVATLVVFLVIRPWAASDQQTEGGPEPTPTGTPPSATPEAVDGVVTSDGLELRHPDGAVLRIAGGSLPAGTAVELAPAEPAALELLDGLPSGDIAWSIEADAEPSRPVEFVVPYDPAELASDARPLVATYDELSGLWLPVETTADEAAGVLTASLPSFSFKTWIADRVGDIQEGASWLEYQTAKLTGNRASRPDCSANPQPEWIRQVITNPDDNAQLFACVSSEGDGFAIHVANNRGYPVAVEFDRPFTAAESSLLDAGLSGLAAQLMAVSGQNRVPLMATGTAVVSYDPVDAASGHLQGWARRDAGSMSMFLTLELVGQLDLVDVPLSGGRTFGISTVECYADTFFAGYELSELDAISAANQMSDCLAETLTHELRLWDFDPEADLGNRLWSQRDRALPSSARKMIGALRVLRGVQVAKWTQTAADVFINDNNAEADLVDIGVRWSDALRWGAGGVGGVYLHELPVDVGGPGLSSGELTGGVLGGRSLPNSTSAWVSCTASPSTLTYELSGRYDLLVSTVGVAPHTPADIVMSVTVSGDGRELGSVVASKQETATLEVDVGGVREITISTIRADGECEASPIPWGVLGDAYLVPAQADALGELAAEFTGTWTGEMTQPSSPQSPYSMEVEFHGGPIGSEVGVVAYDDLGCGGVLTLEAAQPQRAVVQEDITHGESECIDLGFMEVLPTEDGELSFTWHYNRDLSDDPLAWASLSQ